MTSTPDKAGLAHKRFVFDTVFDGDGAVVSEAPRPRRLVPAAEVDVLTEAAFRRGEQSAVARAEAIAAAALGQIAADLAAAMPTLAAVAHDHRAGSAKLAMAAAGKIAGEALALFPEAPAVAALQSLAREVEAMPRLTVHAPEPLVERLQATLEQAAGAAGYPGQITVKASPGMPPAAFTFDWGDGRAAFDPQAAAARVADALQTALAAEGLHGEPLTPAEGPLPEGRPMADEDHPLLDDELPLALDDFGPGQLATDVQDEFEEKSAADLATVFDVPVNISAVLGRANMSVAQLLKLTNGSVLELDRKVGEAIDIYVNNRLVARGEVVIVDDRLGVTMTEIIKDGDANV